ncbi:calponin homology domain-containing protein DDB_G0272472-like isoform X2 [Mytilus californianus]|uniref:calponin homology domain-containing protein DDB_G0272472-like isoform X2 n=1 Tax=Mytilus californianus TaxID=6549 RepID=UPI00224760F0|nr:calponin homology domain-containing protein DDB_G0272472-like isoform X2 [Mytilus californianus]
MSYSAKLPRYRNESPLQQKQRATTSQSMAPKHMAKSISSDHFLTGEPNEKRILQAANNNYFNLSNQGLRLQREWTSLSNTRSMKRASEIVNHRVDRMYFMNGNSIKLKPKYDVDEEELSKLKEEAHKSIHIEEGTFKSHITMQPKGDNPDSNCMIEETDSHEIEDICKISHEIKVNFYHMTEDDENCIDDEHEEERPNSQCRMDEHEKERTQSQCRIDEHEEERPKSQCRMDEHEKERTQSKCRMDEHEEERPKSQCRIDEHEEERPKSQCRIDEHEEERPKSQCRIDEHEEERPKSQCRIDEHEEERPKSQCIICDHMVDVRHTVSIETGIPDRDFINEELNYYFDDIEIDHDHCVNFVDGPLNFVDILSHEDQHAFGKCMIELMTNYSNEKQETKFQKKKPKFMSSGLKKSRKRPKKSAQKRQLNYDAFYAKYPNVNSFPQLKQAKTKLMQKPVDCQCRQFWEPASPCLTITGQQPPAYYYSVWMREASVAEDG